MDMEGLGALLAFVTAWFLSQVTKLVIAIITNKGKIGLKEFVNYFLVSGGMPSGHTASFVSLTVFLGMREGFLSSIFALAVGMTIIVVYDSVNVRRSVGEQGKLLNNVAAKQRLKELRVVEGHTVPQVIVGGLLGILIGWGVYILVS